MRLLVVPGLGASAAQLILSVVLQEMLHMGLAANILTSISGTPSINTRVPKYPGGLPGGVMPTLTVYLGGLTKAYVNGVYMNIEYPERGPLTPPPTQETIGQFYDAICAALAQVGPPFTGNNQMQATIGENALTPVKSLVDAQAALTEIKEQGEGTSTSPDDGDGSELAHYYRFGEIYNGALLVQVSGNWQYAGAPVPFPATYPMAPVPEGGGPTHRPTWPTCCSSSMRHTQALSTACRRPGKTGANQTWGRPSARCSASLAPPSSSCRSRWPAEAGTTGTDFLYTPSA